MQSKAVVATSALIVMYATSSISQTTSPQQATTDLKFFEPSKCTITAADNTKSLQELPESFDLNYNVACNVQFDIEPARNQKLTLQEDIDFNESQFTDTINLSIFLSTDNLLDAGSEDTGSQGGDGWAKAQKVTNAAIAKVFPTIQQGRDLVGGNYSGTVTVRIKFDELVPSS